MSTLSVLHPIVSLLIVLLSAWDSAGERPYYGTSRREEIVASNAVVATDDGRCSEIGIEVLKEGGHAVDAAVAASLCLGVVSGASSGIGGGSFMLIRLKNGHTQAIDMREVAPLKASEDMYHGNETLKKVGILSVAVPGQLAGLHRAWEEHGTLPWERLVEPARKLAHNGFAISPYVHYEMEQTKSGIFADPGLREVYTRNGRLLNTNDTCYNKKLAKTLHQIAKQGIEVFYNGSVGFNLINDIQKAGGILNLTDLRRYQPKIRKPISEHVLGHKLISFPPPSSGGATMILMLNILAQYPIPSGLGGPLGVHRKIEALKNAFAVRSNLGDPDFVNITAVLSDMLSVSFAKQLKKDINDSRTYGPKHYGGKWNPLNDHGTSHMSIIDKERNAVAITNTVNAYFGAQIVSPSTGITLNNEMDDFSMPLNITSESQLNPPPAPANFIRPGKRPLSSMSPTIILKNGKLKAVMGASGGANIIAGTTQVLLNYFVHKMDPLSAVMAPRFYHQWIPNIAYYENWTSVIDDHYQMSSFTLASLAKKGHVLDKFTSGVICQFIEHETKELREQDGGRELIESIVEDGSAGKLVGVSDPRKGGYPAGY
ncbi:Gamma-glutamyltranspeptidase [Melia azedarach]|uniref:Gamma-glutamyltranspeptidase n=1 Tax=Melia azedarach TaxID=155640 RepID=A0ACC1XY37_MELAZ|nr:Gamma-glutamyltranspeptidase [Melia azedarach]